MQSTPNSNFLEM
uniref:Uncharacterized protein n=1 Tax=Lepeophtheirus salmonis TaxID=72036 RepID=A0A0K2T9S6_LEPSM